MMKWLLTTRSGFWWLGLQVISTASVQAYLHATGALTPVYLVVPIVRVPVATCTLWTNWRLRHQYCRHCGRRAVMCWPVCTGAGRIMESGEDGGT